MRDLSLQIIKERSIPQDQRIKKRSLWRGMEFIPTLMFTLQQHCLTRAIWDRDSDISDLPITLKQKVTLLRNAFDRLTLEQRFASGIKLLVFAAIEHRISQCVSEEEKFELINEFKDGFFYYAMAMGASETYKKFAKKSNAYASVRAFSIMPRMEYYVYESNFVEDVEGIRESKRECLKLIKHEMKDEVRSMEYVRRKLYE